jgi:hypothetical protein
VFEEHWTSKPFFMKIGVASTVPEPPLMVLLPAVPPSHTQNSPVVEAADALPVPAAPGLTEVVAVAVQAPAVVAAYAPTENTLETKPTMSIFFI